MKKKYPYYLLEEKLLHLSVHSVTPNNCTFATDTLCAQFKIRKFRYNIIYKIFIIYYCNLNNI